MKASPTMQHVVQQLGERYGVDLSPVGAFLRLDLPGYPCLVIDHVGKSQVVVARCFEQGGEWLPDREVVFFTGEKEWIPIEITQVVTGWVAYAKLDRDGTSIVRINHCGQEKLAEFAEQWAQHLARQNWGEQAVPYAPWTPPSRKALG